MCQQTRWTRLSGDPAGASVKVKPLSSTDLCAYLKNAASELPGLECECSPNFATKEETTGDDLGVNDPQAWRQRAFERMNMKEVWRLSAPYARRTIGVAVIDTGLNFSDPEIAPYRGFFRERSGGFIDGGWNFVDDSSNFTSVNQHGQRCARLIAARRNNNLDMAGMSPNVRLVSLRTHEDNGYGGWANLAEAMDMAVESTESTSSNYGNYVDIAAYGAGVYTGYNGLSSGTSFSCPIVSGAAAILLSMGVKPKYVAGILTHNVDRFASPLKPLKKHAGALNPLKGVKMAIDYPILRSRR
ncbi:Suppressor of the cold-sensitive snRNP bioproteinsis mutant brr1-1 [Perkinsus olseni]|uniref:subtilisin n=1 Tax=Perkinsus olseni TaxID=32597 RepID=A0A7J6MPR0_PEROL|nr:Suppressor of the cold-sensitive snRNP bioproteinsis mutant brr1-1 [Perkinsus olseni]